MSRKVNIRPVVTSTSEYLQPMTSAASCNTFVDVCPSVEPTLAGVDVDAASGPVVIYLLMCASVGSTQAGVEVDAVSGPVLIHLLMCVLVLNQQ